jgi:hypothetical protein
MLPDFDGTYPYPLGRRLSISHEILAVAHIPQYDAVILLSSLRDEYKKEHFIWNN